jgi:hypothetical protein
MEPLDDKELQQLLRQWEPPAAPPSLRRRVFQRRQSGWRWLLRGTIRVPVPVGLAAVLLVVLWAYSALSPRLPSRQPVGVSLADFQPVMQLEPTTPGEQK